MKMKRYWVAGMVLAAVFCGMITEGAEQGRAGMPALPASAPLTCQFA